MLVTCADILISGQDARTIVRFENGQVQWCFAELQSKKLIFGHDNLKDATLLVRQGVELTQVLEDVEG